MVRDMPFLRVDDLLLDQLSAVAQGKADAAGLANVLADCHALAISSAAGEIDRLPPEAIDRIWHEYFAVRSPTGDRRSEVRTDYLEFLRREYETFSRRLQPNDEAARRALAGRIVDTTGRSIKDRHGHGLLLEVVKSDHKTPHGRLDKGADTVIVFRPGTIALNLDDVSELSADDVSLLSRFAPIVVQERGESARIRERVDQLGAVRLSGTPNRIVVSVDTDHPHVYAYTRRTLVRDREYKQLIYCWWFPERPALRFGDPEAGAIDGATIRITLDSRGAPAIVESLQNCGCHHRCYVAQHVEDAARRDGSSTSLARGFAVEKPPSKSPRMTVDDLFTAPADSTVPLIVYSRSATHLVTAIMFNHDGNALGSKQILQAAEYELRRYDELENLPTGFGHASMFGADGLVHDAGRPEGWLLAPTGMVSAGQPRQRGTQLICWDALDFDDPRLLERTLRLPADF